MPRRSPFRLTLALVTVIFLLSTSPAFGAISRAFIMQRAETWVNKRIPYSQTGWANLAGDIVTSPSLGWRRDCSGFASMCWGLSTPGAYTWTWRNYGEAIDKAVLQPGDALVSPRNHAVLFGGWADAAHATYYCYEMSYSASKNSTPTPDGTRVKVTPYPYWGGDYTYAPYRKPGVTGSIDYSPFITPVEGPNRYATAVAASRAAFPAGGAATVIVASGENWPDALGASALAGAVRGPILLTPRGALPGEVAGEIARLGAKEAIIVGGSAAVGHGVQQALDALSGVSVLRLGGRDRFETSSLIVGETQRRMYAAGRALEGPVFVATGGNFPDALAASPIAYSHVQPLLLTSSAALSSQAESSLASLEATSAIVLGGTASVSGAVETRLAELLGAANVRRIAGSDRYQTGYLVALYGHDERGLKYTGAAVATGANFPDALGGGAMAGELGTVLLLTSPGRLEGSVADLMLANAAEFEKPHCLGGHATLKSIVREAIALMLEDSNH